MTLCCGREGRSDQDPNDDDERKEDKKGDGREGGHEGEERIYIVTLSWKGWREIQEDGKL